MAYATKADLNTQLPSPIIDSTSTSKCCPHINTVEPNILPPEVSTRSGEDDTDNSEYVTGRKLWLVLGGLTLAAFLLFLDITIVGTAVPSITSTFNSLRDVGWYGSSYVLATCSLQLPLGKAYEYHSSKLMFLGSLATFELGSLIAAAATSSNMFIAGRAISGCGGAGLMIGGLTIIGAAAPLEQRPKLLGILMGCSSTGFILGPLIGGAVTQSVSWRWCFYLNLPVGAVVFVVLTFIHIPDSRNASAAKVGLRKQFSRLDPVGCIIFACSIIMLLLALQRGGTTYKWKSATIIALFCAFAVSFLIFICWVHHLGEAAVINLSILRNRVVYCALLVKVLSMGGFVVVSFYLPLWFQVVKAASPLQSAEYILPCVLAQLVGTVMSGFLVSKLGYYTPFAVSGGAILAIASGLLSTLTPASTAVAWVCYQLLAGLGCGLLLQPPITAVQAHLPKSQIPIGSALVSFGQNLGSALFISFGQMIFVNSLGRALEEDVPGLNAQIITSVGATNFRHVVPPSAIPGVVDAYSTAIVRIYYLSLGACIATFLLSFGLGWTDVRSKKAAKSDVEKTAL